MARLFPAIRAQVPTAELYITSDYTLWGLDYPDNQEFRDMLEKQEGVHFLGKVSRKELVEHQMTAEVMAYPCTYEECFCIASMECIAAGAVPVTTSLGALKTTVSDSGILLSNFPGTQEYDKLFVDNVVKLLTDRDYADGLRIKGKKRAEQHYSWEKVAQNWLDMVEKIESKLKGKGVLKMAKKTCSAEGCGATLVNSYIEARHMAKAHADGATTPENAIPGGGVEPVLVPQKPNTQLLRFKQPIEVNINGQKFAGMEVAVPFDMVSSVIDTVNTAYGPNLLEV